MNSWAENSGQAATKAETNLAVRAQLVMDVVVAAEATTEDTSSWRQFSQGKDEVVDQAAMEHILKTHSALEEGVRTLPFCLMAGMECLRGSGECQTSTLDD